MKFKATHIDKLINSNNDLLLQFTVSGQERRAAETVYLDFKDTEMSVEVTKYRNKRSLNANGYLWKLLYEIAVVINSNKDDVYLTMLERYGVFTHIIVKPNMVDRIKAEWRTVKVLDEKQIGEQKGVQMLCYFGSSSYDTKEFSALLDGVVSEAKELGIETMDDIELKTLIDEYDKQKET